MTRFRVQCIFRILLLTGSIFVCVPLFAMPDLKITAITLACLTGIQVVLLIRFVESTNQHFAQFLMSIRQSDFSQVPTVGTRGTSFEELRSAYTEVLKVFRKSRAESEERARYLQMVLQQARVGLIGFNQKGEIEIQNHAARKLLQCNQLRHIDDLRRCNGKLADTITQAELPPNTVLKLDIQGNYLQLVINITTLQFQNTLHTLVSLYDIQSELEEKEMEAWHNLIRVLTHEIMNSITPISSLTETVHDILTHEIQPNHPENSPAMDQVVSAVSTIHKRSRSLLEFVENYRKLTRIPNPDFQNVTLADLIGRISDLLQIQLADHHIDFRSSLQPEQLKVMCDPCLTEQVLINLITNAIQATRGISKPAILLRAYPNASGRVILEIRDNGTGIEKDVLEKIFIPFFTTKSEGSGIGLSLSRQIMRLQGGSIKVQSTPGEGSCFFLCF